MIIYRTTKFGEKIIKTQRNITVDYACRDLQVHQSCKGDLNDVWL